MLEFFRESGFINNASNRVADAFGIFTTELWKNNTWFRTSNSGSTNNEAHGIAMTVLYPTAKTVQILASLTASITGGRRF